MSINPSTQYPTKTAAPSASYPYGAARNITVPGDGTGTPWEAAIVNDLLGFQQALLSQAGITPSGSPDTALISEYLNSLKAIFGGNVTSVVFADSPKALTRLNAGLVLVDASAGSIVINLPAASILSKLEYEFARIDTTANTVTINRAGADTIDGKTSIGIAAGGRLKITSDNVSLWSIGSGYGTASEKIQTIGCTQGAGALTFTIPEIAIDFRSDTLTNGGVTTVSGKPADLVLPSGGTLGAVTTVSARLVLLAINNAGTPELAVINIAGGKSLDETGLISTTAISAASTDKNVFYSTTARTNVAYKVVGLVDAINTAGAWGNPTRVQGAGGGASVAAVMHAAGAAPMYACRAWVNFNGSGVVAILGSGNVSSITDTGTGDYVVNFTTAMQDANYAIDISCRATGAGFQTVGCYDAISTTTAVIKTFQSSDGVAIDAISVSVSVFR